MCLIASHIATARISDEDLNDIFRQNSDGLGCMWIYGDDVVIHRTLPKTADEARSFYHTMCDAAGTSTIVWHWRFRTHGPVTLANVHPFRMRDDAAVVHNGIISGYGTKNMSDTRHYVEEHLTGRKRVIDWDKVRKDTVGSRLAVLESRPGQSQGLIRLLGAWDTCKAADGSTDIDVSNLHWQWVPVSVKTSKSAYSYYAGEDYASVWDRLATGKATEPAADLGEMCDMVEDLMRLGYNVHEAIEDAVLSAENDSRARKLLWQAYGKYDTTIEPTVSMRAPGKQGAV